MKGQGILPFESALSSLSSSGGGRVHSFAQSLALSESFTDAPWWQELYRRAFPTMVSAVSVRQDGWAQRGGIDRVITLACGRVFTVDEKVRTNDWPDILLERWSDEQRAKPGWIQKPLACDFIAYAFAPSRRCYLLPVAPLQRAWRMNGRHWIEQFGERRAQNVGYRSNNVPVPIQTLMDAVAAAMVL
ncbi:hypothetical protein [Pelagerythrobacter sp.]|uniref:hypothetical protein n=1 Tax=Pelagerythrobacter sp. TaxID=2800702 RepID=UPI0035B1E040